MSNWVLVGVTFALVLITAGYAWQTRNMAHAASLQAEESLRPLVTVRVVTRYSGSHVEFQLRIANDGRSPALGVKFTIDPEVTIKHGRERQLSAFPLLASGAEAMPAGSEFYIALGQWDKISTQKFTVSVHGVVNCLGCCPRSEHDAVLDGEVDGTCFGVVLCRGPVLIHDGQATGVCGTSGIARRPLRFLL